MTRGGQSEPDARSGRRPPGRLEVICGPMFAGKTTLLIERLGDARRQGLSVVAAKPALDDRYHPTNISSHAGVQIPAVTVKHADELRALRADVIGVDEVHFFESGLHAAAMDLMAQGARLIFAGLDRTSLNEPFGEMASLLIEADTVDKLTAPCAICGGHAVHTVRLFPSRERIVIGGVGMFENRCRLHLADPATPTSAADDAMGVSEPGRN